MTRTPVWFRDQLVSIGESSTGELTADISVPAGATLVRLRWQITMSDRHTVLFGSLPWGPLVYGVWLDDGAVHGDVPDPLTFPDAAWLWWEGVQFRRFQQTIGSPSYTYNEAPADGGVRDSKAQRKLEFADPTLTWIWHGLGSVASVPTVQVNVAYESLWLFPPA
jgi:hypothetical protein